MKKFNFIFALIFLCGFSAFASAISVQVSSPTSGSTVSSPVTINAKATSGRRITGWWIYVDNVGIWSTGATSAISPKISMSAGTHSVIVRAWNSGGSYAATTLTLKVPTSTPAPSVSVSVTPTSVALQTGASAQFAASVSGTTNTAVTWLVGGVQGGNTTVGTISSTGLYKAPTAVPSGSPVTVTARSAADTTKSANAPVTITSAPTSVSVTISPTTVTVPGGKTQQFSATVSGTSNTGVLWSVSGVQGGNANYGTISTTGLYTAPACSATSSVTVRAQSVYDSNYSASSTVSLSASTSTTEHYVAVNGSDNNDGSACRPWATIQHAASVVNPGDTVIVRDGTYSDSSKTGTGSKFLTFTRGGTSSSYVTFKAEHKWGAVLDGLANTSAEDGVTFASGANYIRFQDFEVKGFFHHGIVSYSGGTNLVIQGNDVHNIGNICTDEPYGRTGISLHQPNNVVEGNLIHDIGRLGPGENGCNPTQPYYQNNDHGIYLQGANNITIRNNIFYHNIHGWSIHVYPDSVDNLTIANNTFAFANPWRPGHIIIANPNITNSRIVNNIFYQPNAAGVYRKSSGTPTSDTLVIQNNISTNKVVELYNGSTTTFDPAVTGWTYSTNHDSLDPLLVSPSAFDFHLSSGSPATGAGRALPVVTTDYNGTPRQNPPSIGAYEAGSQP